MRQERLHGLAGGEVLFEFRRIGGSVRVAAIDPGSNTEVVVVGAAAAGEEALARLALRKLTRVLAGRQRNGRQGQR